MLAIHVSLPDVLGDMCCTTKGWVRRAGTTTCHCLNLEEGARGCSGGISAKGLGSMSTRLCRGEDMAVSLYAALTQPCHWTMFHSRRMTQMSSFLEGWHDCVTCCFRWGCSFDVSFSICLAWFGHSSKGISKHDTLTTAHGASLRLYLGRTCEKGLQPKETHFH